MTAIRPIEDLRWYYGESDADIGYASPLGAQLYRLRWKDYSSSSFATDAVAQALLPGWYSPAPMGGPQLKAVAKIVRVRRAFVELSPHYQAAIEAAYALRNIAGEPGGKQLLSLFGIAAGLVRAQLPRNAWMLAVKSQGEAVKAKRLEDWEQAQRQAWRAVRVLESAQGAYRLIRQLQRDADRRAYDRAKEARSWRAQALLAELLGLPPPTLYALRARAWLEAQGVDTSDAGEMPPAGDGWEAATAPIAGGADTWEPVEAEDPNDYEARQVGAEEYDRVV